MSVDPLAEARYGRACLLVLNTCPVTLRRVIDHYCSTKGFNDFEGLLNHPRNIHALFHLSFRQCCCGHTSYNTSLNKKQWDLLYEKPYSRNPHRQIGQCPYYMYTAVSGVITDVMDVTLCCLVLRNICHGINRADVGSICNVRNQLIHASRATLDDTVYNDLWREVETALINLAKTVDATLQTDTQTAIKEMKDRIMNPEDLRALRDLIIDQQTIDKLRQRMDKLESTQIVYKREQGNCQKEKIEHMKQVLLKINARAADNNQINPLLKMGKKVPVSQIYAPVSITVKGETMLHGQSSQSTKKAIEVPQEMFYKDDEPVRYIFLEGQAGRGKTVFGRQILQYWCTAKLSGDNRDNLGMWEKSLDKFDFVFPTFLRHVKKSRTSLMDMVCYDLFKHDSDCESAIRHVVSSDKYRCLFIIDGLDEWNIPPEVKKKLTHGGIPDIEGTSCCSFLFTFRPWKIIEVADLIESCDRHIQIDGLTSEGMLLIVENVLLNFYDMKREDDSFKNKRDEINSRLKSTNMNSISEIPLLVTISTILFVEKGQLADNLTTFYIALVQMLIKEALGKSLDNKPIGTSKRLTFSDINIPKVLGNSKYRTFREFAEFLVKLGEIAYCDLVSQESSLVFAKEELEEQLSQAELDFAVRVGLLSQCEAPGCFDEENVSVNFFHKNVQEFLAALYVVCRDKLKTEEFCKHLMNVGKILELSNVVIFISGLSASLGRIVLEHVVGVTDNDHVVLKWRNSFDMYSRRTVEQLYKLNFTCYLEMKHSPIEKEPVPFYGKDILLDFLSNSDLSVFTEVQDLLCDSLCNALVSMYIFSVPFDEDTVSHFLQDTMHLQSLSIFGMPSSTKINTIGNKVPFQALHLSFVTLSHEAWGGLTKSLCSLKRLQHLKILATRCLDCTELNCSHCSDFFEQLPDCSKLYFLSIDFITLGNRKGENTFVDILPWLNNLDQFWYSGSGESITKTNNVVETEVFHGVLKMSQIRQLNLKKMDLSIQSPYKPLDMVPTWTRIEMLVLQELVFNDAQWLEFILSLEKLECEFNVIMSGTNVNDKTVCYLHSSPHFSVSYHKKDSIYFTKVYDNPPHINRNILSLVNANYGRYFGLW